MQITDSERDATVLRVDGEMFHDDADLLKNIAMNAQIEFGKPVIIDVADLDMLDSDAASILRTFSDAGLFTIEGREIFRQTIVSDAERKAK